MPEDVKILIQERIGVEAVKSYEKYIGLPTVIGKSKKIIFTNLQDKLWKKIKGWKERLLSQGRKEILMKSVAQAIPNYVMNCFKISVGCCLKMESLLNRYWWEDGDDNNKIHWAR